MTASGRPPYPHVHQINVSDGGVPKHPVFEAKISKEGVEGDRQKNLKVHGGPDRAVCLFSVDLIERMQDEGHSIDAGSSGENLTLAGLSWETLEPGTQLKIGPEAQLEGPATVRRANSTRAGSVMGISTESHNGSIPAGAGSMRECCGPAWCGPGMSSRSWRAVRRIWPGFTAKEKCVQ